MILKWNNSSRMKWFWRKIRHISYVFIIYLVIRTTPLWGLSTSFFNFPLFDSLPLTGKQGGPNDRQRELGYEVTKLPSS